MTSSTQFPAKRLLLAVRRNAHPINQFTNVNLALFDLRGAAVKWQAEREGECMTWLRKLFLDFPPGPLVASSPRTEVTRRTRMAAVLECDGTRAVFNGRRYCRIPDYNFSTVLYLKSIEREIRLSLQDEQQQVIGVADFGDLWHRITMMGGEYRKAEVVVIFATTDERDREREGWPVAEEPARNWPCWLAYEADQRTKILRNWRLVLDMPPL